MLISDSNPAGLPSADAADDPPRFSEDIDSTCSTPFVSAPSSPGHAPSGYFFSAPASPMHFLLTKEKKKTPSYDYEPVFLSSDSGSFEFEFSSRFSPNGSGGNGSMTSADELFFNGQIRPMKLLSHLQRPQGGVAPFVDLYGDPEVTANGRGRDSRARNAKYSHRKARSMSPLRTNAEYEWQGLRADDQENGAKENESSETTTPSCSASSSRSSSSSGRNSKKWMFLKDLLHRSKSEGRAEKKERLWSAISFSIKDKKSPVTAPLPASPTLSPSSSRDEKKGKSEVKKSKKLPAAGKPANGVWKRRSAHELHYSAYRAQAEEMKKKTFLPYKQGLLGCLGFSSKSYGAFTGFTRSLNPISSK